MVKGEWLWVYVSECGAPEGQVVLPLTLGHMGPDVVFRLTSSHMGPFHLPRAIVVPTYSY